ncbi:nucleotide exchange factor GrpE [Arthrobacter roseus]|uniref:nucleotide exchange factor GrpE n=1 Tax=Arthrobacter roseus TaxID=136274 RepID=UPI001962B661|nr:nucleotide exchange factor GrpE [Arthrobacter roseus]MBM7849693.1 molecular chaperone GrpE [Arthrobacter roseus]
MANHGNENGHEGADEQEPVTFRDNRKIDPETGKVRGQAEDASGEAASSEAANPVAESTAGDASASAADGRDGDDGGDGGDALSQAEAILNGVGDADDASVTEATDAMAELRNDYLRLQAEYVNYRKRVERDRDVARDMAVIEVINTLMPVLDDIDAARQHGDLADGPFAAISIKLETALGTYGLTRIDETGVDFDPNIHEALIQQQSADVTSDSVSQILRVGYKKNDRVLRAAQVIVAVPEA